MSAPVIPFAPHLLLTQFLTGDVAEERDAGLCLGVEMLKRCDQLWAFCVPTAGMAAEIHEAARLGIPIRWFDEQCVEVSAGDQ